MFAAAGASGGAVTATTGPCVSLNTAEAPTVVDAVDVIAAPHPPRTVEAMITRLAEQVAYRNRFITLFDDPVRFANGAVGSYVRLRMGEGFPGVAIMPIRDGMVGLVHQWRYAPGQPMWEIPRGCADSADSDTEAARELVEETRADVTGAGSQLHRLGMIHPDSGCLETEVVLFAALLEPSCLFAAADEVDDARWVSAAQLWQMIGDGEITDSFTISAATLAALHGHLPGPSAA